MEIKIDLEALRKRKLFVATPMYGGQCNGMYTRSLCDLTAMCVKYGIELRSYFLFNESLITRARNYCVDEFLRSDAEHLLFIDSDIGFNPQDVIAMMALQEPDSPYDVIAGPYPKKCITWEKIKHAVDKGAADQNPNVLEDFVGDFVFNPAIEDDRPESRVIRLDEPASVLETGTGFMMIRRKTFERYVQAYPEIMYRPDHVRTEAFDGSRKIGMYFQSEVDRYNPTKDFEALVARIAKGEQVPADEANKVLIETKAKMDKSTERYLSEDYLFCQNVRKIGMKVYLCPWMHLQHAGTYVFGGKLPALASIGASATADADLLKKFRDNPPQTTPTPRTQTTAMNVPSPLLNSNDDEILKKFRRI
jgi:glycosyltransferase involved in cell wall biosynthesis